MPAVTIDSLFEKLERLHTEAEAIQATIDAEKRAPTEAETTELTMLLDEFDAVKVEIKRRQRLESQKDVLIQGLMPPNSSMGRQSQPDQPGMEPAPGQDGSGPDPDEEKIVDGVNFKLNPQYRGQYARVMQPRLAYGDRGNGGFRTLGEFAQKVRLACARGGRLDPRLEAALAPTTYGAEGTGADGGFAVPPDYRDAITQLIMGEDSLLGRCDQIRTESNVVTLPKDETTPWQTSGGILCYWESEAGQMTQSKPALGANTLRLNKLTALVPITEELGEDAAALDSYLRRKAPEKIQFAVNLAIVQGTGAGQPLGILNSPCLVSQAKESGQTADTVVADNILKMYSRMYAPYRSGAVWLCNQDVEPYFYRMMITDGTGSYPAYLPPGGLSQAPYGTLLGRPVIPSQACETVGDKGDLIFAALPQYMAALKTGGIRAEMSIHLFFDYDVNTYRFILRVAGQPWLSAAIDPRDGSNTMSAFVTLDERA